ncbi:hypothetical protein MSIMFI_05610 [Mycobacterium simulans]|nr:hypothetical protein MSIMFI_05610 [Mycobacterium simulans]
MFGDQQGVQLRGRAGYVVGDHHQSSAVEQRAEDLPHRGIEAVGMTLAPYLSGRWRQISR